MEKPVALLEPETDSSGAPKSTIAPCAFLPHAIHDSMPAFICSGVPGPRSHVYSALGGRWGATSARKNADSSKLSRNSSGRLPLAMLRSSTTIPSVEMPSCGW